jgi:hypothetical protein
LVKQIIDQASLRGLQVAPSGKANWPRRDVDAVSEDIASPC